MLATMPIWRRARPFRRGLFRRNGVTALEGIHAEWFGLAKECEDFVKHVGVEKTSR